MNGHSFEPAGWVRLRHHIQAALDRGISGYKLDDIYEGIVGENLQWWPGEDCAIVTELVDTPNFRFLGIGFAGGQLEQLQEMVPFLKQYAQQQGCDRMRFMGRRGWTKALKDDWQEISTTAELIIGEHDG